MSVIYYNNVAWVNSEEYELNGIYRIIAICQQTRDVALIPLSLFNSDDSKNQNSVNYSAMRKINIEVLSALEELGEVRELEVVGSNKLHQAVSQLNQNEKKILQKRESAMKPFFDQRILSHHIFSEGGIALLVSEITRKHGISKAIVYRWLSLLFLHGFVSSSLNPQFKKCGGSGKKRFANGIRKKSGRKSNRQKIDGDDSHTQKMVEEKEYEKIIALYKKIKTPKKSDSEVYVEIINILYSKKIELTENGVEFVFPEQGTFINRRQFRHIISDIDKVKKIELSTTSGHFNRNLRGLKGNNYQNVAGPGHLFAIDSTIADIYIRSTVNRAWVCGRPIVYIVVDVWSSCIVGFYVCWRGPSWQMAKIALFSTAYHQQSLASLWGSENWIYLDPVPTLPFEFLCDRGEYLSLAATETALETMFSLSYNPGYRPDLKGIVEVLHRIAKDAQYGFIPGALDARRAEMELRKYDPNASSLILREYVQYLIIIFNKFNQTADLRSRLTVDMIADNVSPNPAALWTWGHQVGLGYRKNTPEQTLVKNLLPVGPARINKKGLWFGGQPYEANLAITKQWSTNARNFGAFENEAHYFPGSVSKIWLPEGPSGITEFNLSADATAKPNLSHDELLDAIMVEKLKSQDREYQRSYNSMVALNQANKIIANAKQATAEAEMAYFGKQNPKMGEVKLLETQINNAKFNQQSDVTTTSEETFDSAYSDLIYQILKDSVGGN